MTSASEEPSEPPSSKDVTLWASAVRSFSSQYDNSGWAANMVVGPPQVYPNYGDIRGAWAQRYDTPEAMRSQFVEVQFPDKVFIQNIHIYETFHAGAVVGISALKPNGYEWDTLWTGRAENIEQSRIFSPPIRRPTFRTDAIRLDLDCSAANTWCELDAIQVTGKRSLVDPPPPIENLANDLKRLVNSELFSDVTFEVGNELFHAHKNILCARSKYFLAMFCDGLSESQTEKPIYLPEISPEAFLQVLNYLYSNGIDKETACDVGVELMRAADLYDLPGLRQSALNHLDNIISTSNVIRTYRLAVEKLPILEEVRDIGVRFIQNNFSAVSHSAEFCALPQPLMLELVQKATEVLQLTTVE